MDKRERNLRLELHRVAVAARDIECARHGFQLLLDLGCEPADNNYQPILFGAVASYARPFSSNDGFGLLPTRWRKFKSQTLAAAHGELIEYRNTVVAHSDINTNKLYIYPTGVALRVGEHEHTLDEPMYAVATPLLNKSEIPLYIELCESQYSRMQASTINSMEERFMRNPEIPPSPFEFKIDGKET